MSSFINKLWKNRLEDATALFSTCDYLDISPVYNQVFYKELKKVQKSWKNKEYLRHTWVHFSYQYVRGVPMNFSNDAKTDIQEVIQEQDPGKKRNYIINIPMNIRRKKVGCGIPARLFW